MLSSGICSTWQNIQTRKLHLLNAVLNVNGLSESLLDLCSIADLQLIFTLLCVVCTMLRLTELICKVQFAVLLKDKISICIMFDNS